MNGSPVYIKDETNESEPVINPVLKEVFYDVFPEFTNISDAYARDYAEYVVKNVIDDGDSDFDKAVKLHDWLCDHAKYDPEVSYIISEKLPYTGDEKNVINVIMEEGTFRGLFYGIIKADHSMKAAILIQALLFGIWHIVTPLHNLIDRDINLGGFVGLSIGYVILAGIMGVKWALMYRLTGSLYAGMADHFFNNCIATNLSCFCKEKLNQ